MRKRSKNSFLSCVHVYAAMTSDGAAPPSLSAVWAELIAACVGVL